MVPTVSVSFRKNRDYSNANKDRIISALPGSYKVPQEALNDMDDCGVHQFEFSTEEIAGGFASRLFSNANDTFDVRTNFRVKYEKPLD